ncbi:MAG TPA: hypothetical protein VHF51_04595, partial [Solirubrobacteraceae bacterium]|nr:hypothetical protein [Solirubrobacteraceae bacterium]
MVFNDVLAPEAPSAVAFEAERFEWAAPGRLEVTGRWYGLRGHRFMRPALVVWQGDERRRLLAVLEHKPWAADEGEPWIAAFEWDGEPVELDAAELSVAPTVAVELPPPALPGDRRHNARTAPRSSRASAAGAPRLIAHAERRTEALERELGEARRELERVRGERDRAARAHREEAGALRARASAATEAAEAAVAQRDDARA